MIGRAADRALGLVFLALAAGAAWHAQSLHVPFAADPVGPRAFPTVVAMVLGASGALILLAPQRVWERAERRWPGPFVVLAMAGYALSLTTLGFIPATALLAAAIALAFEARPLPALLTGAVTAVALWALLDRLLDLPLPAGPLGV